MNKVHGLMRVFMGMGLLVMAPQLSGLEAGEPPMMITGFSLSSRGDQTRLLLDTQRPFENYDVFKLEGPRRLVVDLPNCALGLKMTDFKVDNELINRIRFGVHVAEKVRMVVDLKIPVQYLIFLSKPSHKHHGGMVVELIAGGTDRVDAVRKEKSPPTAPKKAEENNTTNKKASLPVKISEASEVHMTQPPDVAPEHNVQRLNQGTRGYSHADSFSGRRENTSSLEGRSLLSQDAHLQTEPDSQQHVLIRNLIKKEKYEEALDLLMPLRDDKKGRGHEEFVLYAIAECLYQIGLRTGYLMRAVDAYQIAHATFPDSKMAKEALFRMGNAYSKMHLMHEANSNFQELVEGFPDDEHVSEALYLLGANYMAALKFKDASKYFHQLVKRFPGHEKYKESIFNLGQSLEASGDISGAVAVYDEALAKFPEIAELPANVGYSIVRTYLKAKGGDEFKKIAFRVLNIFPADSSRMDVLQEISRYYLSEGRPALGIQTLLNALYEAEDEDARQGRLFDLADLWRRYPDTGVPFSVLTENSYLSQQDIFAQCARVASEKKGREETLYRAGLMAMDKGDFHEAIRLFEKPLGFSPKGPFAAKLRNSLAEAIGRAVEKSFRETRYDEVVKLHLQKLKEDATIPLNASTLLQIGESYRKLGLQEYSVPVFRKALGLSPETSLKAKIVSTLGKIYYDLKKWQEVIDLMMVTSRKDHPPVKLDTRHLEILGGALFHVEHFDNAARILEPVSSQLSPAGKFCLARAYHKLGNIEKAENLYRQDVQFVHKNWKNDYAPVLNNCTLRLGDLFFQQRRFSDARAEYQQLLDSPSLTPVGLWSLHRMILIALREGEEKKAQELLTRLSAESNDSIWSSAASTVIRVDSSQREALAAD